MSASETPLLGLLHASAPGAALASAVRRREAWLPCFLETADTIPAGPLPYHEGSVLAHTARCMDAVAGNSLAVWMALTHDAGKLTTPAALWPHHYGHETRGKLLAAVWARELALPGDYALAGILAAMLHMKAGRYARLRPGKKFDLLRAIAASGFFAPFWKMVDADTNSAISTVAQRDWQRIRALSRDWMPSEQARRLGIDLLRRAQEAGPSE